METDMKQAFADTLPTEVGVPRHAGLDLLSSHLVSFVPCCSTQCLTVLLRLINYYMLGPQYHTAAAIADNFVK